MNIPSSVGDVSRRQKSRSIVWQFRRLGRVPALLKLSRWYFRLVYRPGRIVEIARGPLRGLRWKCASGEQYWMPMGVYETETARWLKSRLKSGSVFADVGANAGYFTLMAARSVGQNGLVYSFEPDSKLAATIREKLELNSLKNTTVVESAVADREASEVAFVIEKQAANSHLREVDLKHAVSHEAGCASVPLTTLDKYFARVGRMPDVIKIDVEGAELHVLRGMSSILATGQISLIVSTHSGELNACCRELLASSGYQVGALSGFDHEIVAVPYQS